MIGPERLITPTLAASTRIVFCSNSPLQEAVAAGLEGAEEHNFFSTQNKEYVERRDVLCKAFDELGMKYTMPQGSYFVLLVRRRSVFPRVSVSLNAFLRIYPSLRCRMITRSPSHSLGGAETSST